MSVELTIKRPVYNEEEKQLVIDGNFTEVEEVVKAKLEELGSLVLTEDNLQEVKDAKKQFQVLRTGIDREFKEYKKVYIDSMKDAVKSKCDNLLAIIAKGENALDVQLEEYDQKRINEMKEVINIYITEAAAKFGLKDTSKVVIEDRWWKNKTIKENEVVTAIENQVANLKREEDIYNDAVARINKACEGTSLIPDQYTMMLQYGKTPLEILDMIQEAKEMAIEFNKKMEEKIESGQKVEIGVKLPEDLPHANQATVYAETISRKMELHIPKDCPQSFINEFEEVLNKYKVTYSML